MGLINLNNEQKLIQSEVRKFTQAELEPQSAEIDKTGTFPGQIVKKLSDLGLLNLIVPERYGGSGLDTTSLCIAAEELSKSSASVGMILIVNNCLVAFPIIKYGNDRQKDVYLPKLGQGAIGGFISEQEIEVPNEKLAFQNNTVTGRRNFVLNGDVADFFIMPISSSHSKTLCLLTRNDSNINITRNEILGMKGAGIVGIEFKATKLEKDNFILPETKGIELQKIYDYANIGFAAIALGIAQAALEASMKYAKERKQFGRPIGEFPMVQEMLVDMKTKIENARLSVYEAAAQCDSNQDYSLSAKLARLCSCDAAVFNGLEAIQVFGGYGYIKDYPVERYFRDAKVLQVLQYPPHDLKSKIAKELLV